MARLASQAKGGFYATPPTELAHLLTNHVVVKPGTLVNVLDPCCGEGEALRQIGGYLAGLGAKADTYGVEIEAGRAAVAKTKATKVLHTGYENMRASNNAFNLAYINPPYDWSSQKERMELIFFRDLTAPDSYIQPGALVIFCIPQYVLKDVAYLLVLRLEKIRVVRFTDQFYPSFKQVFVLGYRRKSRPTESTVELRKSLEELALADPSFLPTVDIPGPDAFLIPAAQNAVAMFRGSVFDSTEVAQDIDNSSLWKTVENMLLPANVQDSELKRPLLPAKVAQIAVALSAGAVGGNMGNHIIRGVTKRQTDTRIEYDENGTKTTTEIQKHITVVRAFVPYEGVFDLE